MEEGGSKKRKKAQRNESIPELGVLEHGLKLPRLMHLRHDVATPHELPLDEHLRDRWPLPVYRS